MMNVSAKNCSKLIGYVMCLLVNIINRMFRDQASRFRQLFANGLNVKVELYA